MPQSRLHHLVLLAGLFMLPQLFSATTITLQQGVSGYSGTTDTFVTNGTTNGADPARNYGGAGALAVSATGLSQGQFQSLIEFNLASAKTLFDTTYGVGGWAVTSVALSLVPQTGGNAIFNSVHSGFFDILWVSSDSWTEGSGTPALSMVDGITYNGLSALLSSGTQAVGNFNYDGTTGTVQKYTFTTLSAGLLNDVNTGSSATFDLAPSDSQVSAIYNSKSFGTAANRPLLTIVADAVPEPGRACLCGFALLGMTRLRYRSRA